MATNTLSIVVPAHNEERYIARCLAALLEQKSEIHEILVVDNNSTDRTAQIVEAIAAGEPLYVYAKDADRSELVVGTDAETRCAGVEVADVNFIARARLDVPERLTVKTHYRQHPRPATVEQTGPDAIRITFDEAARACAPGQAAVVYDGDAVVCGGTIAKSF